MRWKQRNMFFQINKQAAGNHPQNFNNQINNSIRIDFASPSGRTFDECPSISFDFVEEKQNELIQPLQDTEDRILAMYPNMEIDPYGSIADIFTNCGLEDTPPHVIIEAFSKAIRGQRSLI